jgi:hypothetical protein
MFTENNSVMKIMIDNNSSSSSSSGGGGGGGNNHNSHLKQLALAGAHLRNDVGGVVFSI